MLLEKNTLLVFEEFAKDPLRGFLLRDLSRRTALSTTAVKKALQELSKFGLIAVSKSSFAGYPAYSADREGPQFRRLMRARTTGALVECGLVDYLADSCQPDVIVLFGSAARGEDTGHSDIDLYVQSKERNLELDKFEKKLCRRVQVLFEPDINKIGKEIRNNIFNGTILQGYLRVF